MSWGGQQWSREPERSGRLCDQTRTEEVELGPIPTSSRDVNEKDEIVGQAAYSNGREAPACFCQGELIDPYVGPGNRGNGNAIYEAGADRRKVQVPAVGVKQCFLVEKW